VQGLRHALARATTRRVAAHTIRCSSFVSRRSAIAAHRIQRSPLVLENEQNDLARAARIDVPDAQALSLSARGHTFAVRRFDRADGSRRTFASAMTLPGASESEGFSYLDIAGLIEAQGSSAHINKDLEQLFRRVLFNVLVSSDIEAMRDVIDTGT
jgi:serine/threonine protein kinase HipA of HipAB toxin-antitoxin module